MHLLDKNIITTFPLLKYIQIFLIPEQEEKEINFVQFDFILTLSDYRYDHKLYISYIWYREKKIVLIFTFYFFHVSIIH